MAEIAARRRYVRTDYAQKVARVQGLCRRIEAGASFAEACRDPEAPGRTTMVSWLVRYPELKEMSDGAAAAAAAVFGPRRAYHRYDPEVAAEVLARIEDGRGLAEVCAELDMPVHQTVTRWLKERPEYAEAYRLARLAQADRLFDLAWRIACEATEDTVKSSRLKIETLKWRVGKLAPRVYGPPRVVAAAEQAAAEPKRLLIEVRRFARAPDGRVVDVTRAARGMDQAGIDALHRAVEDGRWPLVEEEDGRIGAHPSPGAEGQAPVALAPGPA